MAVVLALGTLPRDVAIGAVAGCVVAIAVSAVLRYPDASLVLAGVPAGAVLGAVPFAARQLAAGAPAVRSRIAERVRQLRLGR